MSVVQVHMLGKVNYMGAKPLLIKAKIVSKYG